MPETIVIEEEQFVLTITDPSAVPEVATAEVVTVVEEQVQIIAVGEQGPRGAAGVSGDLTYVHNQGAPASTWSVAHNLGKKPSVMVVDSGDNVVHGEITYVDDNNLLIEFSVPFGGKAYMN